MTLWPLRPHARTLHTHIGVLRKGLAAAAVLVESERVRGHRFVAELGDVAATVDEASFAGTSPMRGALTIGDLATAAAALAAAESAWSGDEAYIDRGDSNLLTAHAFELTSLRRWAGIEATTVALIPLPSSPAWRRRWYGVPTIRCSSAS